MSFMGRVVEPASQGLSCVRAQAQSNHDFLASARRKDTLMDQMSEAVTT